MMTMRNALAVLFSASFVVLTSGCASIVSGNHQTVSIETPPMKNVTCSLTNNKGKWFINGTPGSVMVQQSYGDMMVNCERNGETVGSTTISSSTKPWVFGNILFWAAGIITAAIDIADGAAYTYPQTVSVTPQKG